MNISNTGGDFEITPGPDDAVSSIAWSPVASNIVAAGSWDKKIRVWEIQGASCQPRAVTATPEPILSISFSHDGSQIFAGACDNFAICWDLASNQTRQIAKHEAPVKYVKWLPGKKLLVTGSWDRTLKYWDPRQSGPISNVDLKEKVYAADFSDSKGVVACSERLIYTFDLDRDRASPQCTTSSLYFQSRSIALFPDNTGYCLGGIDGRVCVHPFPDTQNIPQYCFKCHRSQDETKLYPVNAIDFRPGPQHRGQKFATCGSDGIINFWDRTEKRKLAGTISEKDSKSPLGISTIKFNPTGELIAYSTSYDWLFSAEGYEKVQQHNIRNRLLINKVKS